MLNSLPGIFYLFDEKGKFLRWNLNFEAVSEYSTEEIRKMSPLDFFEGADRELIEGKIRDAFKKGSADAEAEFITKSGKRRPYYYTARIIQVEGRSCLIGMGIDIAERRRMEEALRKSEEHFRRLTDQSPVSIAISDERGNIEFINRKFLETFGYIREDIPTVEAWFQRAYPDERYRREVIAIWTEAVEKAAFEKSEIKPHEYSVTCKDGTIRMVEIFGSMIGHKQQVLFNDITGRRKAEHALREKEFLLSESQRIAHIGSWSYDVAADHLVWTPETYRIYGVLPDTFVPSVGSLLGLIHPDDRSSMQEWLQEALSGKNAGDLEFRIILPDGSVRFLNGRGGTQNHATRPNRLIGTVQDVTDRRMAEETIRYQAYHDLLTGLPNMAMFQERLRYEVAQARAPGRKLAVFFLDLDRFKNINDSIGHQAGDMLIREFAGRLSRMQEFDTIARIGSDEFTMLLPLDAETRTRPDSRTR